MSNKKLLERTNKTIIFSTLPVTASGHFKMGYNLYKAATPNQLILELITWMASSNNWSTLSSQLVSEYICWFTSSLFIISYNSMQVRELHTYLLSISSCSFWSSKALTERSEMLTVAEAVKVTSSTRKPSPSSRGSSSLWVCSLLRVDRSTWHLGTSTFD